MKRKIIAAAVMVSGIALFMLSRTASAYSVYSSTNPTPTMPTTSLNSLFLPFENFINSINLIGQTQVAPVFAMPNVPPVINSGLQAAFTRFDNWVYGITGIQISGFFPALLTIYAWVLGILQAIVAWLIAWLH